jgi:hypothetical protein
LDALPDSLKLRIDLALKKQLIRRVPIFQGLPPSGVVAIVRALRAVVPTSVAKAASALRHGKSCYSRCETSKNIFSEFFRF